MSDTRPSLENRLSSRLSRSYSPSGRLMERVARHAGSQTPLAQANERRLGTLSRLESFGSGFGTLGAMVSRMAARGSFRSAMPAYGSWGGGEFVTEAPPWFAAPEVEAPREFVSGWHQSSSRSQTSVSRRAMSTANVARQASRPPGFSARRSAARAPELVAASLPGAVSAGFVGAPETTSRYGVSTGWSQPTGRGLARSPSSRPVSALSRAAAAGMTSGGVGARVARVAASPQAPAAARVLARAAGTRMGAARRAVARSVESELPVSSAGRALARSEAARPSGRGFAVARSSFGPVAFAPALELARAPVAPSSSEAAVEASSFTDLSAGWDQPVSRSESTARVSRSWAPQREHAGARVARSIARSTAARAAVARPLARATAASASAPEAPRSFSPLTSPVRRSAAPSYSPFVGATVSSPVAQSTAGAPTAGAATAGPSSTARLARRIAPVERALARRTGGATQATRAAASALPRMAATLSATALDLAGPGPIAQTITQDPARPVTSATPSQSGWAQPLSRSAAPQTSRPLTGARVARSSSPARTSTARVARSSYRPLTGARVARAEYSAFAPAPVASPFVAGPGSTAALVRSATPGTASTARTAGAGADLPGSTARIARSAVADADLARSITTTASTGADLPGSTARIARAARSARVPTAVARAAADSSPFVGARVARSRVNSLASRADAPTSTVARSFARGVASAPATTRRSFAPSGAPALTLADAPVSRSTSVEDVPTATPFTDLSAGWARPASADPAPASPWVSPRGSAPLSRSAATPPAARALARYEAPRGTARTAAPSYGSAAGAPTAGAPSSGPRSSATVARRAQRAASRGAGLSRLLARDAEAHTPLSGQRGVARSLTTAATLGTPPVRRSRMSSIEGTLAGAPIAARAEGPAASPTERVVQGFARPESTARTAGPGSELSRSTAPTARALARAGVPQAGGPAAPAASDSMVQRAAQRMQTAARHAEGSRARPMSASRAVDTLAQSPGLARREDVVTSPASTTRTGWVASRSAEGAPTVRTPASSAAGARVARSSSGTTAGAPTSSVSRALSRSSEQSSGTSVGLGFQSPRSTARRAVARSGFNTPGLPVVVAPGLSRSAAGVQPGFDPGMASSSPGTTGVSRSASSWAQPLAGPTVTPTRTPALARHAERDTARRSTSAPRSTARRASQGETSPRSTAAIARATYRSAEGAPTARWSTSTFQGAALARAVGRSEAAVVSKTGTPLARQAQSPSSAAAGWAQPLAARSSAVRRRAAHRAAPGSTAPVARAEGGGGFRSDMLVRLKKIQQAGGLGGNSEVARSAGLDVALPNAGGMVSRAANKMLARHEAKAKRREAAAMPLSSATLGRSGEAMPIADLARAISRQVAEMTHITGAAPTVSRSSNTTVKRSSSAQEAQGRGADRDVGKKPDLDDFLRRAVRRVMIEESVVQSRELSFLD